MATNKNHITPENITEWLASTGWLFPRSEMELERFDKLYGNSYESITGDEVDPVRIIKGIAFEFKGDAKAHFEPISSEELLQLKMVARNGNGVPQSVFDKMKKNQSRKKDDSSSAEKTD